MTFFVAPNTGPKCRIRCQNLTPSDRISSVDLFFNVKKRALSIAFDISRSNNKEPMVLLYTEGVQKVVSTIASKANIGCWEREAY